MLKLFMYFRVLSQLVLFYTSTYFGFWTSAHKKNLYQVLKLCKFGKALILRCVKM